MAWTTERFAVSDFVTQLRMRHPRQNVVRVHTALCMVSTILADVSIAAFNRSRPRGIFRVGSVGVAAALPCVVVGAAILQQWFTDAGSTDSRTVFWRQLLAGQSGRYVLSGFWSALHAAMRVTDALRVLAGQRLAGFQLSHELSERIGSFGSATCCGVLLDPFFRAHSNILQRLDAEKAA